MEINYNLLNKIYEKAVCNENDSNAFQKVFTFKMWREKKLNENGR